MSLDVYLVSNDSYNVGFRDEIFIRENGQNKSITRKEWDNLFPNREPVVVTPSLNNTNEVYSDNITHNLGLMAEKANLYKYLWHPEEVGATIAKDIIEPLRMGLNLLKSKPEYFKKFNPKNGWGDHSILVNFVEKYLDACENNPNAEIQVWR